MQAYVFPGQGAQFTGMGQDLFAANAVARDLFAQADEALGFTLSETMFTGSDEELKQTKITQPAIFTHSVVSFLSQNTRPQPGAVAGHSLGEFSALVAAGVLDFADALQLVQERALAMQDACDAQPGTMAAVLGMEDEQVEAICATITDEVVVPANYNSPGQLVISGSLAGVERAAEALKEAGAKRVVMLPVGGAFHSPLMQPAQDRLQAAIEATAFSEANCPVYQNVDAQPTRDAAVIQQKLIQQLTSPVRWTQSVRAMIADGTNEFIEVGGNGKVLKGLIMKIDRSAPVMPL
jgi:[acyl-carrier-protein] S-malonyltransferase